MLISQIDPHFPKLYSYGDDYIIREYINGSNLYDYLKNNTLSTQICDNLIKLYNSMKYVGFTRVDCSLLHIFLIDNNNFKLIDTSKAMRKNYTYPTIIIQSLNRLGYKDIFLNHIKNNYPEIYSDWSKHIDK